MTFVDQRPFNSLGERASWDTDASLSIVSDATAPESPSSVLRATYPAGFTAGAAPGHAGTAHAAFHILYIRFVVKLSSNWVGNGSNTNKLFYEWTQSPANPSFFFSAEGSGGNPLSPWARLQNVVSFPVQGGNLAPNLVPSAQIIRGRWHVIETILTGNSSGVKDGMIDWYLDGVHIGHITGFQWTPGATAFNTFEFRPVWGGVNTSPAITSTQTMDLDNVYISGKN